MPVGLVEVHARPPGPAGLASLLTLPFPLPYPTWLSTSPGPAWFSSPLPHLSIPGLLVTLPNEEVCFPLPASCDTRTHCWGKGGTEKKGR